MLNELIGNADFTESSKTGLVGPGHVGYARFDDVVPFTAERQSPIANGDYGCVNPRISELIELSGALEIAEAAWLCRIGEDHREAKLVARSGAFRASETADVLTSLAGVINFEQASAPFRWSAGGHNYIICVMGRILAGQLVLFLRTDFSQAGDWPKDRKIAKHVQRLLAVSLSIDEPALPPQIPQINENKCFAHEIANQFPFGIVVIDSDQSIILVNAAMEAFFTDSLLIGNLGGKLSIFNSDDAVRFRVALQAGLSAANPADRSRTISLARDNGRPLLLTIAKMVVDQCSPQACVMVTDAAADYRTHIRPLADTFGLTAVETRLVMQLADGSSVQEAALRLRLKVETVRTYLKQIFQKTGTHRQIELIGLMKSGGLPFLV